MPPHLLMLPRAIRDNIYSHVIEDLSVVLDSIGCGPDVKDYKSKTEFYAATNSSLEKDPRDRTLTYIFQACRQLYNEFRPFAFSNLPLVVLYPPNGARGATPLKDPISLLAPEHVARVSSLTITNEQFSWPRRRDANDLLGSGGLTMAASLASALPAVRKIVLNPYIDLRDSTSLTQEEVVKAQDDFGHFQRLLHGEGVLSVVRNEVGKAWEKISPIQFHNNKGEVIDAELVFKYGSFLAVPRRQSGDNIRGEFDRDYRWSTDVNSEGWYLSYLAGFRGYFFTATATQDHDGGCSVAIRFSDEWNKVHSRANSDMKWIDLDDWEMDTQEWGFDASPQNLMMKGEMAIPDWVSPEERNHVLERLAWNTKCKEAAKDRLVGQRSEANTDLAALPESASSKSRQNSEVAGGTID